MSSVKGKFPSISIKRKPKGPSASSQLSTNSTTQSQIFRPLTPEATRRALIAETTFEDGQVCSNSSINVKDNETEVLESPSSPSPLFSESKVISRSPRPQSRSSNHRESLTSLGHNRSGSVNSESSIFGDLIELPMVDQEDIIALTYHVRAFSEALGALRNTFFEESESPDDKPPEVKAHERLGEVLSILKGVLNQYQPLHSTDILAAAGTLINKVKSHNYEESDQAPEEFCESIDQLALAFSSSVSDFLMGDQDLPLSGSRENSRSLEDFADDDEEDEMEEDEGDDLDDDQDDDDYRDERRGFNKKDSTRDISKQKADELDKTLFGLEHSVDLTLQRTKVWSKYAKDIATYLERRAHLELEFTNKLAKLAQQTRASITEDRHLPFQTIYVTSLDQDIEYADNCARIYSSLLSSKFLEPLQNRRTYHEKKRKDLKDQWTKAYKKLNDAITKLEKAKQSYIQKQQEIEKFKSIADTKDPDLSSSFTRTQKKKQQDDVRKADEAEDWYRQCVSEANVRQKELLKTKSHVLVELRQLIYQCDQTMKAVTCNFFQLMHSQSTPAPIRFQCLAETSRTYEPGCQFSDFVYDQVESAQPTVEREFAFESYPSLDKPQSRINTENGRPTSPFNPGNRSNSGSQLNPPGRAWPHSLPDHLSDAESTGRDSAPVTPDGSPLTRHKPPIQPPNDDSSDDESTTEADVRPSKKPGSGPFVNCRMSVAAKTHKFKKLRAPSRCRDCDSYVYFNGAECADCGLACHRKCLAKIVLRCDKKRDSGNRPTDYNNERRMTTFGVDFYSHLQATRKDGECVPYIVSSCIEEINKRGLTIKGIYRVSAVKSKVEKVCQTFENNSATVDLSYIAVHVIAAVLKLYLRQLPEPLLTFKLYPEFIKIAKEIPDDHNCSEYKELLRKLREVVVKLPRANFKTASKIINHLKLITKNDDENQMSAGNLGIVFGPTLLRPRESATKDTISMSALVDMAHQTKAVELIIDNPQVFDEPGVDDPASQDTPVEDFNRVKTETESVSSGIHSVRSRDSSSSQAQFTADDGSKLVSHGISSKTPSSPSKRLGFIDSGFLDLLAKSNNRTEEKEDGYTMPEFLLPGRTKDQHKDTDESNDDSTHSTYGTSGFCTPDDDLDSSKGSLIKEDLKPPKSPTSLSPTDKVQFSLPSSNSMPDIAAVMSRSSSTYSFGTSVSFGSDFPDEKLLPDHSEYTESKPKIPEVPGENHSGYIRPYPKKTVDDSSVPSRTRPRPHGLGFLKRNSDLPGMLSRFGIFPAAAKSSSSETDLSRKTQKPTEELLLNSSGSSTRKHPGISEALREMHIVYDPILHANEDQPKKNSVDNLQEKHDETADETVINAEKETEPEPEKETKEWYDTEQDDIHEMDSKDNTIEFVPTENQQANELNDLTTVIIPMEKQDENPVYDIETSKEEHEIDDRSLVEEAEISEKEKETCQNEAEGSSMFERSSVIEKPGKHSESNNQTEVKISDEIREKMRKSPRISVKDRRRQYEAPNSTEQSTETSEANRKPTSPIGNIDLASRKQFFESIEKGAKKDTYKKLNDISRRSKSSSLNSSKEDLDQVEDTTSMSKLNLEKLEKLEHHSRAENAEENGHTAGKAKEPAKLTSRRVDISLDDSTHHHDVKDGFQKKHLQSTNSYPLTQKQSPKPSRRARRQFPEEKTQEDREPQFV